MATYDSERYHAKRIIYSGITGTLLGTVAANALGNELFKVPANTYGKITGVTIKVTNGGTLSGTLTPPQFGIATAGTVVLAQGLYGTRADNTYLNLTPTANNQFDAGDVLSVAYVAGTTADASQVFTVQTIEWQEHWE